MKTLFHKLLNSSGDSSKNESSAADLAHAHKKQGNEYLNQGMIDEAIMHYTKSIVSSFNFLFTYSTELRSQEPNCLH